MGLFYFPVALELNLYLLNLNIIPIYCCGLNQLGDSDNLFSIFSEAYWGKFWLLSSSALTKIEMVDRNREKDLAKLWGKKPSLSAASKSKRMKKFCHIVGKALLWNLIFGFLVEGPHWILWHSGLSIRAY